MNFKKRVNGSWTDIPYYLHNTSTDTLTTLPADLYADGTDATVGLVGNMSQASGVSPTTPIQPQGCGELETNLAIISGDSRTIENRYYTDVRISDVLKTGTYTVSYVIDEKTGNASTSTVGFGSLVAYQKDFKSFTVGNVPITITATVTLESEGCLWARFLRASSPTDFSYSVSHVRVEKGGHSYGYKIPISSAGQTTPVYLGEVQTTREIKEAVLTGQENWTKNDAGNPSNYLYYQTGYLANKTCVCSHLEDMGTLSASKVGVFNGNNVLYLNFGSAIMNAQPSGNTVEGLKQYLAAQYAAGTPVCVWYVLATPQTAVVNEPLRKIGDYADTVSGITIPTIAGANTLSIGTTLQPSEVTATYKGWHPVQSVHEYENDQWD